jgi:Domain of unknown function (DUF4184)
MPFTVSHVAAVLPAYRALARARLFTAAVIGSMVPDFGLLLPGSLARWQTHSVPGLFIFCLPVGLIVYALSLLLIKPALMQIVPDGPYVRLRAIDAAAPARRPGSWLLAALAIVLGAITHLIWDAFTHENARGVRMFPVLDAYAPELDGHSLRLFHLLQYGSSVAGLLVVMVALAVWLRHAPAPAQPPARHLRAAERWAWAGLYVLLPLMGMALAGSHVLAGSQAGLPAGIKLGRIAIAGMRSGAVTLVLLSLLLRARLALIGPAPPPMTPARP